MEGIAATADTSIGSVYQFFPNKKAVFREVAQQAIASSGEAFATLVSSGTDRSWSALLDHACELYFELHRRSVMMRAVVRNFELYREFEADDVAQMEGFVVVISSLIHRWAPQLEPDHRTRIAHTLVYTFGLSMVLIASEPDAVARGMLDETKLMLRCYLEVYCGPAS